MSKLATPALDVSMVINAPAAAVFGAFFNHEALQVWWQVTRSVTTPRLLGPFAVEWAPDEFGDDVVGRLGGVFRGTIMHIDDGRGFFVADAYWLPPDGGAIGPMALEVSCTAEDLTDGTPATRVRVTQSGFEEGSLWRRYYELIQVGWDRALRSLKMLLEA
jgi:uncharacterized protein YndB with AHSA1/START domain